MDTRTYNYLKGRFGDYYRTTTLPKPPAAEKREWGYIPWSDSPGTRMFRHNSLSGVGGLNEWVEYVKPQHLYFSGTRYEDPGAPKMSEKGWVGADVVFDIDSDHLPGVDEERTPYAEMLSIGKRHTQNLLEIIQNDFGFTDIELVFSGGRGYHIHIRDDAATSLSSEGRRELVEYVTGRLVDAGSVTDSERDVFLQPAKSNSSFNPGGGWSRKLHEYVTNRFSELSTLTAEELERSDRAPGIGKKKAKAAHAYLQTTGVSDVAVGDIPPAQTGLKRTVSTLIDEGVAELHAAVDEPVTTDVNRLIRVPRSIHGKTGLVVQPIALDELEQFDPLSDAIPQLFLEYDIRINLTEEFNERFNGVKYTLEPGEHVVPEALGIFMMGQGMAEKLRESL